MIAFVSTVAALLLALVLAIKLRAARRECDEQRDLKSIWIRRYDALAERADELHRQLDATKRLYWAAVDASVNGRELPKPDAIQPVPLPSSLPAPYLVAQARREETA